MIKLFHWRHVKLYRISHCDISTCGLRIYEGKQSLLLWIFYKNMETPTFESSTHCSPSVGQKQAWVCCGNWLYFHSHRLRSITFVGRVDLEWRLKYVNVQHCQFTVVLHAELFPDALVSCTHRFHSDLHNKRNLPGVTLPTGKVSETEDIITVVRLG